MSSIIFALRQLRSAWRAGEVRVLLAALVLAVGAMTTVGFFADRIQSALVRQGSLLLGADMLIVSDHALPAQFAEEARRRGLAIARALEFPSMVMSGDEGALAEIKAVSKAYPLRGKLLISDAPYAAARVTPGIPEPGSVWIEARLAGLLHTQVGGRVAVGDREFVVSAILSQEPARGGDLFSIAPRLLMNLNDVAGTGLIQYGSRISYRLLLAGKAQTMPAYSDWAKGRLKRGERMEDVRSARPEVRNALDKTQRFLGLASMASVILSMVAMALAAMRYAQRHLDTCALMRCFGASQGLIMRVYLWQTLLLGLLGGVFGCLLGYAAQAALSAMAGSLFLESLPPPTWYPAWAGMAAGLCALLGIMLPHLLRLRGVPALRILRRDLDVGVSLLAYLPAFAILLGLVFWSARDARLGWIVLAGLVALLIGAIIMSSLMGLILRVAAVNLGGAWRIGMANLLRRPGVAIAQIAGFSLGLMAMLLLTIVRGDLLNSWQESLPPDAPNRFVINIQPDQLKAVGNFFEVERQHAPGIFPMVRGRLVALNGNPVTPESYTDDRARRLASREFNLSWAAQMQPDNRIVAGRWWRRNEYGQPLLSMEQGIAESLGIKLGDKLTYDVGGTRITLRVQSLRKVEWDSMRPNFFAVTPPGVLESYPASYLSSFYLSSNQDTFLNRLIRRFPNLTVIDVAAILAQVRAIMDRMAYTVQFVFGFSLLAGLAVLYAAITTSRQERCREAALLRVLGASWRQVMLATVAEFVWIGGLAGIVATIGASVLAWFVSERLLGLDYAFDARLALVAIFSGCLLVPLAAWLGLRGALRQPPRTILQNI